MSRRAALRRKPERGSNDEAGTHAVLDCGFVCHVGFVVDGQPFVIPMLYGRSQNRLYLHGLPASRLLDVLRRGSDACVTVTQVDGIVLARSLFHHSLNYRSAVLFGRCVAVPEIEEKMDGLRAISDQVMPGRWMDARQPNERELKRTHVAAFDIEEASVKARRGPPNDDEADYALDVWAGVAMLRPTVGGLQPDRRGTATPIPDYIRAWLRRIPRRLWPWASAPLHERAEVATYASSGLIARLMAPAALPVHAVRVGVWHRAKTSGHPGIIVVRAEPSAGTIPSARGRAARWRTRLRSSPEAVR